MEALTQALKIGTGLAAMVAVAVIAMPERPTLLGGGDAVAAQGSPVATSAASAPRGVELAQAAPAAPSEGQLHLERLRQLRAGSAPSTPAPAEPAPQPAPAPTQAASTTPAPAPPPEAATPEAPPAPSAARGLDSLTQPAARPQYRLFRQAEALDTATISADGETIRLAGVVPISGDARCGDGTPCGTQGRQALGSWLADREVLCAVTPGAAEAPCVRGEEDIGEWVVANGWATAEPGSVYEPAENNARDAGLGIWGAGGL